jgi:hypothetical protein
MLSRLVTALWIGVAGTAVAAGPDLASFTVLEGRHAQALSKQCSREDPPRFDGTWQPNQQDVLDVEAHLPLLQRLKASRCCIPGARVTNVHNYYRQYLGLVVVGRRVVYINAFSMKVAGVARDARHWASEPMMACDGGENFWGAVYDPATKTFSELAFNGRI